MSATLHPSDPEARAYALDYCDYLYASPTPYHAVDQAAVLLSEGGFQETERSQPWPSEPGAYFVVEGGTLIAWVQFGGEDGSGISSTAVPVGFAVVAGHTDSPGLKLKPVPQRTTADGWGQLMVERYGGPTNNSWLDRELRLAGAVQDWDGNQRLIATGPIAFLPQLAPHLNREVNTKGLVLDPQKHMQPLWTVQEDRNVMELVAHEAGFDTPEEIASSELFLVPSEEPGLFGVDKQFVMSARQDNLSSCFAGLDSLLTLWDRCGADPARWESDHLPVLALFDHEEVGSGSPTGARSPLLGEVMQRTADVLGITGDQSAQMLARSTLLSVDAAHSVNPAYEDKHGPDTRPVMGGGPVLKMDADQSYSTSLGGVALWRKACRDAGIPNQVFVSHSSMRAGSTVGPLLATRFGLQTADVGIPLLSMHSTRETSHVLDPVYLSRAINAYWSD